MAANEKADFQINLNAMSTKAGMNTLNSIYSDIRRIVETESKEGTFIISSILPDADNCTLHYYGSPQNLYVELCSLNTNILNGIAANDLHKTMLILETVLVLLDNSKESFKNAELEYEFNIIVEIARNILSKSRSNALNNAKEEE